MYICHQRTYYAKPDPCENGKDWVKLVYAKTVMQAQYTADEDAREIGVSINNSPITPIFKKQAKNDKWTLIYNGGKNG